MPPKTELILSPFSPASPGILDHELPLVAKRRGPRDDQIVQYSTLVYQYNMPSDELTAGADFA